MKLMLSLSKMLLLSVIALVITPQLHAATEAPSDLSRQNTFGAHRETVEDIRVKVQGGFIRHTRSWNQGKWYFNRRWENLYEKLKDSTSTAAGNITIYRGADEYDYKGSNIYGHESDPAQIIIKSATGYRWQNRKGDWIEYNENRRAIKYSDRNNNINTFQYDTQDRMTGVFDVNNKQIYWYEYNLDGKLSLVKDYTNRKVEYKYTSGQLTEVIDVRGNSNKYTYISGAGNDQLASKIDAEGRETVISYTANGLVSGVNTAGVTVKSDLSYDKTKGIYTRTWIYSTGKSVTKNYNSAGDFIGKSINGVRQSNTEINGLTRTTTDQAGNRTTKTYDQWDNLLSTIYPDGSKKTTAYEHTFTRPVKEVNENGVITLREYDDRGNLTKLTEAAGLPEKRITSFTYDAYGNQLSETIHADAVSVEVTTRATYDAFGNRLTTTDGEQHVTDYTYDVLGNVLTRTDPLKHVWTYTYDEAGNQLSEKDPLDHITKYGYDKVGNLTSVTDALQRVTRYEYDARNNRVAEINALNQKTVFKYNGEDRLIETTDAGGRSSFITYNIDGQIEKKIDGNGNVIQYEYIRGDVNGSGQVGRVIYPTYSEAFVYNNRGRIIEKVQHLSENIKLKYSFIYNRVGNRISDVNPEGRETRYIYDAHNRLIEEVDPLGGATKKSYDSRDNMLSITNANNGIIQYSYNKNSLKSKEIKPLGEETKYLYDPAGRQTSEIDANNHKRISIYDAVGRKIHIKSYTLANDADPVKTVSYIHNSVNKLKNYSDGTTSGTYQYDDLNRLTNTNVNFGGFTKSFSYTYDASGNKASFTGADGIKISYTYDNNNHLGAMKIPDIGQISLSNYQWKRPQKITLPGGSSQNYIYDSLMRIEEIDLKDPASKSVLSYTYSYDEVGNITDKTTEHGAYKYIYDELDRLTTVDNPTQTDEAYSYDILGNRLTVSQVTGTWSYNLNNELTGIGIESNYTYDEHGSLTNATEAGQVRELVYNADNRLAEVIESTISVASYNYDAFGRRITKHVDGQTTYYLYGEEGLIAEMDQTGAIKKQYGWKPSNTWGTDPVYLRENAEIYFYQNDHLGTPQKLISRSGAIVWSSLYTGFGEVRIKTEFVVNNIRLPGQYYDGETGLYYNYFRDYDPSLGRYLESDPIGLQGGINTYIYALNNPVKYDDPKGLSPSPNPGPGPCSYYDDQCEKSKKECDDGGEDCYACNARKCCESFPDNPAVNCTRDCLIRRDGHCAKLSGQARSDCRYDAHIICYARCLNIIELIKDPRDKPECQDAMACM